MTALIIFDCDGVLIDSEGIACRVDAECLGEIGIAITAEEIMERYVGVSSATMFVDIERRYQRKLPADLGPRLRERIAAAFETQLKPMPRVDAVLHALQLPRCVASSSAPERLRHSLTLTGLLHHFEPHVFSAIQVARGKPAPDLFLFAAAQLGIAPRDCLVIEDSIAGAQAGRAAGMRVFGFTGGGHCRPDHAGRLRAAGAEVVFAEMSRLPSLL